MNAAEIIARLKAMEPELRSAGLDALYLFGSRARGEERADSDVDLLFEASGRAVNLWERAEIMAAIVHRLGVDIDIDLVDRQALLAGVRRTAEPDLVRVF